MVDVSSIIDTSGSTPQIDSKELAAVLSGTIVYGWFDGVTEFIARAGAGVTGSIDNLGLWLASDLIASMFGVVDSAVEESISANTEFLEIFGILAQLVALVETIVIMWIVIRTLTYLLQFGQGYIRS